MRKNCQNSIVQVDSWLKRVSPKGDGSFAFEVVGRANDKGSWHLSELRPAKDPKEIALERKRDVLRQLIEENPDNNQTELATLASRDGQMSRDETIEILRKGVVEGRWMRTRVRHGGFRYFLK